MADKQISMHDLYTVFKGLGPNELILDVRTEEEFANAHVPGSRNIPYDSIEPFADELKKYSRIYVHCQAGRRALIAVNALAGHGLTNLICVTNSGMGDWLAAGFPVEN